MANNWFAFKQFTVWHDKCGMKVGTDGVLLGAWADVAGAEDILDIGTGTGLIALMLAQRLPKATIDAIEIEKDAFLQARDNFQKSKWTARLNATHADVGEFAITCAKKYGLIVSNPPYFTSAHRAADAKRAMARHSGTLPVSRLVSVSASLLSESGKLEVILPMEKRMDFISELANNNLWLRRETRVLPYKEKSPVRVLFGASFQKPEQKTTDEIVIRESPGGGYSNRFKQLTKEYYLAL